MEHEAVNDELRELASLYTVGALPPDLETEFEQHLQTCNVCAGETRAFRESISCLPLALNDASPPPHLREKLLARIQQPAPPPPDFRIIRAGEGDWQPMLPGVVAKRLYSEPSGGNAAMLMRMEAGAQFPPHWHADVEHCYVLEGDLHFGDLVLGPGDYQCAMASTSHIVSHTENGCTVLVVVSQQNRILPWTR